MTVLQIALILFIMANPIGTCPAILALLKDHSLRDQQRILLRESIFSLLLALFFLFSGEAFLSHLSIQNYTLTLSGGVLIFLVSIGMIFSSQSEKKEENIPKQEPYFVPIATPLISGAGVLSIIMLYSRQEPDIIKLVFAILVAFFAVTVVLVAAPYLQVILKKRGIAAFEQLMGLLLLMISVSMITNGVAIFISAIKNVG